MSKHTKKPKSSVSQVAPVALWNPTFAILLKAVPIKLDVITKLTADGVNFDVWEADIVDYSTFIPDAPEYLKAGALPTCKGYLEDMANGVKSVIHWTIDRQLGMRIRKMSPYPSVRMDEIRKIFSGVSYANRLSLLSQLTESKYKPGVSTLDVSFSKMANIRERLGISGMEVSDDIYAGLLALGAPSDFPDIAHTFEAALLANPKARINSSNVMRTMGAGDVLYKRNRPTSTDTMKGSVSNSKKDSKEASCHYFSPQKWDITHEIVERSRRTIRRRRWKHRSQRRRTLNWKTLMLDFQQVSPMSMSKAVG